jgi:MFS family permease
MLGIMAGMQMLARSFLTYEITSSAILTGVVGAANALPMLFLSLFGGAIADRFDRKRIVQVGQFFFAVLSLVIGFVIVSGAITWQYLMIGGIIQGAVFSFLMPARQAIVPSLVPASKVTNAMALSSAAMSAMTLTAPAFAGAHYVYFVTSGLAFAAVVLTNFVPKTDSGPARQRGRMMSEIKAGLTYIGNAHTIKMLLIVGLVTTVLAQPFRFLMPVFVVEIYHVGPEFMGLLMAVMGGASLVGALAVASLGRWKRGLLLMVGGFLSAIALMLVAAIPIYFAAMIVMIPLGLGDAARRTLNQALVLELTEDQYRGRVMSVFMLNRGMMPLGVLPTALLIDYLGPQIGIGILGGTMFIFMVYLYITQKPLRRMN